MSRNLMRGAAGIQTRPDWYLFVEEGRRKWEGKKGGERGRGPREGVIKDDGDTEDGV